MGSRREGFDCEPEGGDEFADAIRVTPTSATVQ
jgi:hypothetical protein